jgi:hypothetical protein
MDSGHIAKSIVVRMQLHWNPAAPCTCVKRQETRLFCPVPSNYRNRVPSGFPSYQQILGS